MSGIRRHVAPYVRPFLWLFGISLCVVAVAQRWDPAVVVIGGGLIGLPDLLWPPSKPRGELPDLREAYPPSRF